MTQKEVLDSFVLEFQSQRAEAEERFPKRKRAKETTHMLPKTVTQAEAKQFILLAVTYGLATTGITGMGTWSPTRGFMQHGR